jgi:protein-S-isoprenylcysteine O-methyltransferase Ste14
MYVGVLFFGCSLGVAQGNWLIPCGTLLVFTLLAIRTKAEEKFLIARFGDQYRNYMQHVGRFFPKLS